MQDLTDLRLDAMVPFMHDAKQAFRQLKTLVLAGYIENVLPILNACSSSNLVSLTLQLIMCESNSDDDYEALCWAISWTNLEVLGITMLGDNSGRNPLEGGKITKPLLKLRHLEEIVISLQGLPLDFNNEDVSNMSLAWPNLKQMLIFQKPVPNYSWKLPDLVALIVLSENCTELTHLSMVLDVCAPCVRNPPVTSHQLRVLGVSYSPLMNMIHLARFICYVSDG